MNEGHKEERMWGMGEGIIFVSLSSHPLTAVGEINIMKQWKKELSESQIYGVSE